jgi:hypothetical protein
MRPSRRGCGDGRAGRPTVRDVHRGSGLTPAGIDHDPSSSTTAPEWEWWPVGVDSPDVVIADPTHMT